MNFIEKEKLIKADIVSIENRVRHAFNQGYDLGFNDGKKAKPQDIDYKAQYERFSKKADIVISQLRADRDRLEDCLDKIRAEIMSLTNGDTPERIWNVDVLEIIDKYKEESEG
jgi:flagellar biosynthesis/type III secretory pathway protein FliH